MAGFWASHPLAEQTQGAPRRSLTPRRLRSVMASVSHPDYVAVAVRDIKRWDGPCASADPGEARSPHRLPAHPGLRKIFAPSGNIINHKNGYPILVPWQWAIVPHEHQFHRAARQSHGSVILAYDLETEITIELGGGLEVRADEAGDGAVGHIMPLNAAHIVIRRGQSLEPSLRTNIDLLFSEIWASPTIVTGSRPSLRCHKSMVMIEKILPRFIKRFV